MKAVCGFIHGFWRFYHQGREAPFWLGCLISLNLIVLLMGLCVVVLCGMAIVALTAGSVGELALWKPRTAQDLKLIMEGEESLPCEDEIERKRG